MSKFLIANMIRGGATVRTPSNWGSEVIRSDVDWNQILDQSVYFDASIPSSLYWEGKQNDYSLEDDFGPLRPPYPEMWMEWSIPRRVMIDGKWRDMNELQGYTNVRWAAHITSDEYSSRGATPDSIRTAFEMMTAATPGSVKKMPDAAAFSEISSLMQRADQKIIQVRVTLFMTDGVHDVVHLPIPRAITIDPATGHFIKGTSIDLSPRDSMESDPTTGEAIRKMCDFNVPWLTLNIINCRNVQTRAQGCVFPRTGAEKRRGTPLVKYNTIILPGHAQQGRGGRRNKAADESILAQHRVRGHFKTFTAERPLMGQHVGTYWWGWQVRGKKENGVVVSDYKMKASA